MSEPKALMKSWVELVTSLTVIYDGDPEPSAPSPLVDSATFTYAAINFTSDESPLSTAYEVLTDTAGSIDPTKFDQVRSLVRRGELDVAIYGPGADDYCRALELSMGRQDVLSLLLPRNPPQRSENSCRYPLLNLMCRPRLYRSRKPAAPAKGPMPS